MNTKEEHAQYLREMLVDKQLTLFVVKVGVSKTGMTKYMRMFIAPMANCLLDVTYRYAACVDAKLYDGSGVLNGSIRIKGVGHSPAQHVAETAGAVLKLNGLRIKYEVM